MACEAPEGLVASGGDCDDGDAEVHPGALHECRGTVDLDCDGVVTTPCDVIGDADRRIGECAAGGDLDGDGLGDLLTGRASECAGDYWPLVAMQVIYGSELVAAAQGSTVEPTHTYDACVGLGAQKWLPDLDGDGRSEFVGQTWGSWGWPGPVDLRIVTAADLADGSWRNDPDWGVQATSEDDWNTITGLYGDTPGVAVWLDVGVAFFDGSELPLGDGVREWVEPPGTDRVLSPPEGGRLMPEDQVASSAYPEQGLQSAFVVNADASYALCFLDPTVVTGPLDAVDAAEFCVEGDSRTVSIYAAGDLDGDGEPDLYRYDGQGSMNVYSLSELRSSAPAPLVTLVGSSVEGEAWVGGASATSDIDGRGRVDIVASIGVGELRGYRLFPGEDLAWGGTTSLEDYAMGWNPEGPPSEYGEPYWSSSGADFNGDGQGDLLVRPTYEPEQNTLSVIFGW